MASNIVLEYNKILYGNEQEKYSNWSQILDALVERAIYGKAKKMGEAEYCGKKYQVGGLMMSGEYDTLNSSCFSKMFGWLEKTNALGAGEEK